MYKITLLLKRCISCVEVLHTVDAVLVPEVLCAWTVGDDMLFGLYFSTGAQSLFHGQPAATSTIPSSCFDGQ